MATPAPRAASRLTVLLAGASSLCTACCAAAIGISTLRWRRRDVITQTVAPEARVMPTTGIHNLRDYGGYKVSGIGRLALGRLFRSGEPANPTTSDLRVISDLNLTDVFDLRGSLEREKSPSRWPPDFAASVFVADGETTVAAPHIEAAAGALDAETARRNFRERYASVPFRPILVAVYREYFHALERNAERTLVYCTAGKDRTGVLVALLHRLLGVHSDDVFDDYLLTNTAGDSERRVAALRDDLQRRFGAAMSEDAIRVVTTVEPAFLQTAFDAIDAKYGTLATYFDAVLGVTPLMRERIVSNLIE